MDQTNTEDRFEKHKKLFFFGFEITHRRNTKNGLGWCGKEGETRNTTNHFHMISLVEAYTACTMGLHSVEKKSILFEVKKRGG
jgi:hypothetical protein